MPILWINEHPDGTRITRVRLTMEDIHELRSRVGVIAMMLIPDVLRPAVQAIRDSERPILITIESAPDYSDRVHHD